VCCSVLEGVVVCCRERIAQMTDSTEHATLPKFAKSRNSNSSVQIQIGTKFQFQFVPRHNEESEFLDLVDFGGEVFSVETVV